MENCFIEGHIYIYIYRFSVDQLREKDLAKVVDLQITSISIVMEGILIRK